MRYVVEQSGEKKITIEKEIEFIKNYVALQKLRFEDNELICTIEIVGHNLSQNIEPGIYLTFVENAFKHGAMPENKSAVNIRFDLQSATSVVFRIENTKHPNNLQTESSNTGIKSTKERLNLLYPNRYKLEIIDKKTFLVELMLITNENNYN